MKKFVNITQSFENFLNQIPGCVGIDSLPEYSKDNAPTHPDYMLFEGRLIIEIKTLMKSQEKEKFLSVLKKWGFIVYGNCRVDAEMLAQELPDESKRAAFQRELWDIFRNRLQTALKKASEQLRQFEGSPAPEHKRLRMVILINEDIQAYEPNTIYQCLQNILWQQHQERFRGIDAVLYMTHHRRDDGSAIYTLSQGQRFKSVPNSNEMLNALMSLWGTYIGVSVGNFIETDAPLSDVSKHLRLYKYMSVSGES